MSVSCMLPFLKDSRAEVRKAAIEAITRSPEPLVDELAGRAMNDSDDAVSEAARRALLYRQPWLILHPFPVRAVPGSVLATEKGQAWQYLRKGIRQSVREGDEESDARLLERWRALPGAVPDIIEELTVHGRVEAADALASACNLYGGRQIGRRQILLAPTYRCNRDCEYCYAKGWQAAFGSDLSIHDLERVLSWISAQGIELIILCGGEPTVYEHFGLLLAEARKRNMAIMLTTNGLYSEVVRDQLRRDTVEQYIGHYDQGAMGEEGSLRSRFLRNLRQACQNGIDVFLRYTLTADSRREEWMDLVGIADRLNIDVISYGFAFKNVAGNNCHYDYHAAEQRREFEQKFVQLQGDCRKHSLHLHQSKPFPLCLLSQDTLRSALLGGAIRTSCTAHRRQYSQNVTINPDLSTFPCNGLGIRGPKITEFENISAVGAHYSPLLKRLQDHPLEESCRTCLFFYRGFCQGVCLAEHYNEMATGAE